MTRKHGRCWLFCLAFGGLSFVGCARNTVDPSVIVFHRGPANSDLNADPDFSAARIELCFNEGSDFVKTNARYAIGKQHRVGKIMLQLYHAERPYGAKRLRVNAERNNIIFTVESPQGKTSWSYLYSSKIDNEWVAFFRAALQLLRRE